MKFISVDIKFYFTRGESNMYLNLVKFQIIMTGIVVFHFQRCQICVILDALQSWIFLFSWKTNDHYRDYDVTETIETDFRFNLSLFALTIR